MFIFSCRVHVPRHRAHVRGRTREPTWPRAANQTAPSFIFNHRHISSRERIIIIWFKIFDADSFAVEPYDILNTHLK